MKRWNTGWNKTKSAITDHVTVILLMVIFNVLLLFLMFVFGFIGGGDNQGQGLQISFG